MRDILVLSEGTVPKGLAGSANWPDLAITVVAELTHSGMSDRLIGAENIDAVVVAAAAPSAVLSEALAQLSCMSVEVQASNPNRHADGTPNLSAEPLGADAIVHGLGDQGFATALFLLNAQLRGQTK